MARSPLERGWNRVLNISLRLKNRSSSRGFSLVELLVSLLIISAVGGSALSLLYMFMNQYEQTSEYTLAEQRGQMVLAILEPAVIACSLGIPNSPDLFEDAFAVDKALSSDWGAPLVIGRKVAADPLSSEIKLVYPLQVPYFISDMTGIDKMSTEISSVDIELSKLETVETLSIKEAYRGNKIGNNFGWVVFPSLKWPLYAVQQSLSKNELRLTLPSVSSDFPGGTIARFDSLMLVRTMEVYLNSKNVLDNDALYISDNMYNVQPMVRGVLKIYFELDKNDPDVLHVYVMTRGDKDFGKILDQNLSWPRSDVPTSAEKRYRLSVTSATWRVRN